MVTAEGDGLFLDIPDVHTIQGDTEEADRRETVIAMFESCSADRRASTSIGCIFAYSCRSRGMSCQYYTCAT